MYSDREWQLILWAYDVIEYGFAYLSHIDILRCRQENIADALVDKGVFIPHVEDGLVIGYVLDEVVQEDIRWSEDGMQFD